MGPRIGPQRPIPTPSATLATATIRARESPDLAEAVRWWNLAAEQGNSTAMYNLGICYDNGYGVTQDFRKRQDGIASRLKAAQPSAFQTPAAVFCGARSHF